MGNFILLYAISAIAITMLAASDSSSWVLFLAGTATLLSLLISYRFGRQKVLNLPPGPRNLPVLGAIMDVKPPLHKTFQRLAAKYGPIVYLRLGVQTMVVVSSPEIAKDLEFADRLTALNRSAAKYIGFDAASLAFSRYDAQTKLLRKVLNTEFFTVAKLKEHEEIRTREIREMVEKISTLASSDDRSGLVNIRAAVYDMNQNIMFQLDFGRRFDDLEPTSKLRKVAAFLNHRANIMMKPNLVDYFPSRILEWLDPQGMLKEFRSHMKEQTVICNEILEEQKQIRHSTRSSNQKCAGNLVDSLLQVQEEGGKINDSAVMATSLTVLSAGVDTSAVEVEWAMLELARHPKLLQTLQNEIDGVVGKERPVVENDLQALPFLNAVAIETLRLHAASAYTFPHVNTQQATLGGYDIPPNTAVILNIFSIGRDPKLWKNPVQFNPYRFILNGECADQESWNSLNLLTFGAGRRGCPGSGLGKLVVARTVATLVHAFDWSPPPGLSVGDISLDEEGHFILRPVTELLLTARPRLSPGVYKSTISNHK